jgi:hypothetical protein
VRSATFSSGLRVNRGAAASSVGCDAKAAPLSPSFPTQSSGSARSMSLQATEQPLFLTTLAMLAPLSLVSHLYMQDLPPDIGVSSLSVIRWQSLPKQELREMPYVYRVPRHWVQSCWAPAQPLT